MLQNKSLTVYQMQSFCGLLSVLLSIYIVLHAINLISRFKKRLLTIADASVAVLCQHTRKRKVVIWVKQWTACKPVVVSMYC